MRVLLVKAPSTMHAVLPPIGIGYVLGYLRSKMSDKDISILDCLKEKYDHKKFAQYVKDFDPDIIGFTAFSMEIESVLKCCEIAKQINKGVITVIGGPHPSNKPDEVLSNEYVDFIFRTEGEIGFCELLQQLRNGRNFNSVSNLGYKEDGKRIFNPLKFTDNLDDLPFPSYDLIKVESYPKTYMAKGHPYAPIITSRGCPYPCTYCSAGRVSGKKLRIRSPENIIEEIKLLKKRHHIKEFQIWDDNFTLNKKRVYEFCSLLVKENIDLPWWCPNGLRIETLNEDLIRTMKETGLYAIALGIESGSEKIQKDMKKNLNFEKVREIIQIGNKYKIRMQGFFILGYPTESREDILQTIKLAKKLPLKRASFLLFQPLVGSEIYEDLEKKGKLNDIDLNTIEFSKPSILPEGIGSKNELKQLHRKAILEFYLRPKIMIPFLIENFTVDQLKEIWVMVKKYIFKI